MREGMEFGLGPRVVPFRQIKIWGGGFYRGGDAFKEKFLLG